MGLFDFGSIKKSLQGVAAHIKQVHKEIETLKREREDIAGAPASRDDVKQMVRQWISQRAAVHQKRLAVTMHNMITNTSDLLSNNGAPEMMTVAGAYHKIGGVAPGGEAVDGAMCAFFGPALADGLCKMVDTMEWPAAEGLSMAERTRKLEGLDARIATLTTEADEMTRSARAAGIVIALDLTHDELTHQKRPVAQ
jgi:hypothetical protein